jgi:hypothetical protein
VLEHEGLTERGDARSATLARHAGCANLAGPV